MTLIRKFALGYFFILLGAAALNYVPGITDKDGLAFGIFALDLFDDALHLVSALWALAAALLGARASKVFLVIFGALYLGDGVFGFFTGWGYLDFGIFTNPSAGLSFTLFRVLANLPHIALGGVALVAGLRLGRGL
ncbi:hypothetical protein [Pseudosulfitobacter sp. DSM 107133]|jgi:hypothetical protein|uniref:hypothetical protein n=1 Tax=Pseudosulfitobacter sp. DSM 107133 TaxID=2883100 RepID=UPI000DF4B895|nr:hypothetical protein [Pseudosulfitobacter sp. DSM 107133]UOA26179.1 hypothetical protein DSM107133_00871 [Pseudosulfitobacter sp. DSM 107133]